KHNYGPMGGVKHSDYNKLVKLEVEKLIKSKKGKLIDQASLEKLGINIRGGLGFNGKENEKIKLFNSAVHGNRFKYCDLHGIDYRKGRIHMEEVIERGDRWIKSPKFRNTAIGAILIGWLFDKLGDTVGALDVASSSNKFRDAIGALVDGDLVIAENCLFG